MLLVIYKLMKKENDTHILRKIDPQITADCWELHLICAKKSLFPIFLHQKFNTK
jgi:hypothetical protein